MEKKKILIFPAGSEIAFEIQNALKYSKFVEIYGGNSMPSHAEFVFERYIDGIPFVREPSFVTEMNKVLDQYGIDYIYPAHDSACMALTREADKLHAKVVTSPLETVEICRSKNKTYDFFADELFIPSYYRDASEIHEYPVFLKPDVGQGAVGAKKIEDELSLLNELKSGREYAICEYLSGDEYTVDCFTDKHGILRVCHQRKRDRIKAGIAVRSSLVKTDEEVRKIAEVINSKLKFNGAWFFQLKQNDNGEYKLMEISPRIPGTMGVSRNLGINFPLLTLYNMWGFDVEIIENAAEIMLDRAFISRYKTNITYSKVYLDFDDTLYIGNKVNIEMVSFLYQCQNKQIPVVLLTKHAKNIHTSLAEFAISEALFEEIIHIDPNEEKTKYITEQNSILIDDSFAERKKIHDALGIPVYDLDMVESLIDWRM